MEETQVCELMGLYSGPRREAKVGEVVYTAREVQELVAWARSYQWSDKVQFADNGTTFERLARRHVRGVRPWEVRRAMSAWGIGRR